MRYRGVPSAAGSSGIEEAGKKQRVSTKLVILLAVTVVLFLLMVPDWTERTKFVDDFVIRISPNDDYSESFPTTSPRDSKPVDETKPTASSPSTSTSPDAGDEDDKDELGADSNNNDEEGEVGAYPDTEAIKLRTRPICPRTATKVLLFFPHVNKAGGRTVEGTFEPVDSARKQFRALSREKRSKKVDIELIDGHRDYDELKSLAESMDTRGSCVRWMFMLREPMSRTLSAFNTVVGRTGMAATRMANHFYCESERVRNLMKNATWTFEDFAALPDDEIRSCQRNYHVRYLAGKGGGLEKAKRRLQRMAFIGIAEDFALSMQLLSWEMDLELELYTPVFNKNPYEKEGELSDRAKLVLQELNQLDMALYDYARQEIFNQRVMAMREYFGGSFPWEEPATCDSEIICWDKRAKNNNLTWSFKDDPPHAARLSDPGEQKENVLCAPKGGCRLARPEAHSAIQVKKSLPPPLKNPSQSQCIASVFVVGARKGGTTSLYQYLAMHPNFQGILLDRGAQSGETFFFETRSLPADDERALTPQRMRELYDTIYTREFKRQGLTESIDRQYYLTGESSVGMGPSCYSPRVVKETCGSKIKVIYLLRNPVDRMLSQYQMRYRLRRVEVEANFTADSRKQMRALISHPLWKDLQTWLKSDDILSSPPPCLFANDFLNSLWSGLYLVHLARWYRQLKEDDLLVIQSEAFFKRPKETLETAMQFVGLNLDLVDTGAITSKVFNAAPSAPSKEKIEEAAMLNELKDFFQPYNRALADWLHKRGVPFDANLWGIKTHS